MSPEDQLSHHLAQRFPAHFIWGVATSSFQIEGAAREDGKGESIWDRFCTVPGAIADASNGDVACDHYHRLDSDLDLIASLGVNAYRFSVSWPRVQPDGAGAWNSKGLDFYERLVDGLLRRGIKPHLTLNHWDLPQALQDQGGWTERATMDRFVAYAQGMHRRLGDRLAAITTHNEPWVIAVLGHEQGNFAPGIKSRKTALQVTHHLMVSHGMAVQALRADGCKADLGIVLNLAPMVPATDSPEDAAAALKADAAGRRWYTDPLFLGQYPHQVLEELGADAPVVHPGDMAHIATPIDYLGVNYYTRQLVSASGPVDTKATGLPLTEMGWEIYARGLTDLLLLLHKDYKLPAVLITENGGAFKDPVTQGQVHDADRTDYLRTHIAAVADALDQGVPMAGYMVWSLMDNFEWASGYVKRFGIVHVDYASQKRTLKDSAHWYRDFLATCPRAQQPGAGA
jgi:beta-glucosidase